MDLADDSLAGQHMGTLALGIRHVLCTPLSRVRYVDRPDAGPVQRPIGVLYLDSRERGRLLSPATQHALEAFATEAAARYRKRALVPRVGGKGAPRAGSAARRRDSACAPAPGATVRRPLRGRRRVDSLSRHRRRLLRLFQPAGWSLRLCARGRGGEGAIGGASHGDDSGNLCLSGQHGGIRGRVDGLRERGPDSPVRAFAVCHLRVRARWRRTDA